MNLLPILAATEAAQSSGHSFAEVVVALAVLAGACYLTGVLTKRSVMATLAATASAPAPAPASAPVAAPAPTALARSAAQPDPAEAIAPETVAVIAAAVEAVMDSNYKIVAIKPQDSNWGQAGRQSVLSSHKIR